MVEDIHLSQGSPQRELTRVHSSFLILILVIEVQDLVCPVEELPLSVAQSHC